MAWIPEDVDPSKLAAIRSYALKIESLAMSVYIADRSQYQNLANILRNSTENITGLRSASQPCDCPPDYVCVNGRCEPA